MSVLIDSSEKRKGLPDFDQKIRCPQHPKALPESMYGLAGGGFGPYTVCPDCARILSKTNEDENEE